MHSSSREKKLLRIGDICWTIIKIVTRSTGFVDACLFHWLIGWLCFCMWIFSVFLSFFHLLLTTLSQIWEVRNAALHFPTCLFVSCADRLLSAVICVSPFFVLFVCCSLSFLVGFWNLRSIDSLFLFGLLFFYSVLSFLLLMHDDLCGSSFSFSIICVYCLCLVDSSMSRLWNREGENECGPYGTRRGVSRA